MNKYDVLIIGAGPGGCKAAIECLKKGFSVIVVEKKKIPGVPVHCGECVSKFAFENTGIEPLEKFISKKVKGVRVTFPGDRSTFLGERGYVLNKDVFEQWLFGEAQSLGAETMLDTEVTHISYGDGSFRVKAGGVYLKSKLVIDASGVSSVAGKLLNINKPFKCTTGLQYEVEKKGDSNIIDFFLWPHYTENGYIWTIPKGDGRYNVGALSTSGKDLKKNLLRFLEEKGFEKEIYKTSAGRIPSEGPLNRTFTKGLIIIGDAAGFTSPLFEGGTHLALKSACFAAEAAGMFLKEGYSLNSYEKLCKGSFPDYNRIIRGKRRFYKLTMDQMVRLGGYLPKDVTYHSFSDKVISGLKILIRDRDLIFSGAVDIMRAFEYSKAEHYGW